MAKKSKSNKYLSEEELSILNQVLDHHTRGVDDMDQRRLRKNGWNDVLKAYHGVLPDNWPYLTKITDPIIRTTILEKTARLFNGKLRGRLVPRETGDVIKAKINNAILEYQWDNAQKGGSMIEKWAYMDVQTRLYGASFALCYWNIEYDEEGNIVYEGNEFKVLDPRDVIVDYTATHVKNANWVQIREWKTFEELEEKNKSLKDKGLPPLYKNLEWLKEKMLNDKTGGDRRDSRYESQMKNIRGLEDRVGQDKSFPVVEIVTEMRKDEFIVFAPRYNILLNSGYDNPYGDVIPVVQLRYYPVPDDIYGESEVESVIPLSRGINALLCGAVDEANISMKPPIKVAHSDASVRIDTLGYGPNAVWKTGTSVNNVQEHQFNGQFLRNFETMYSALKAAFNSAMGDSSLGVSSADPFGGGDKTATEIKNLEKQKLSRDQYNQLYLEQALKDQMMLWLKNNKTFLFTDPTQQVKVIRIIGKDMIKDFREYQLSSYDNDPEAIQEIINFINENTDVSDEELEVLMRMSRVPKFPVIDDKQIYPKVDMDEEDETAILRVEPDDMDGYYDYIPDVSSMAMGVDTERKQGRQKALEIVLNDKLENKLAQEGYSLQAKDIIVQVLEDSGYRDGEKFIQKIDENQGINAGGQGNIAPEQFAGGVASPQGMGIGNEPVSSIGQQQVPQPTGQQI